MSETKPVPLVEANGTEIIRFNALKHGVLSQYTVLPWENPDEYHALVAALAAEHAPHGPAEDHLVEELAGILWRKRRLRMAEASALRRGLEDTISSYRPTAKAALAHLGSGAPGDHDQVANAIRITNKDTEGELADIEEDEALTRRALDLIGARRNDAYGAALAVM